MSVDLVSPAIGEPELPDVETELELLSRSFDRDVIAVPTPFALYAIALGRRGIGLWRGVRQLCREDNVPAAAMVLRSEIELVILLAWMAGNPDERLPRWHGESERGTRTLFGKALLHPVDERRQGLTGSIPAERLQQREDGIARAKQLAASAGEQRLVPSVEAMAEETKSVTLWETYQIAYRYLSAWAHAEHGTFDESLDGTDMFIEDARFSPFHVRLLAATVSAVLIALVGLAANLPISDSANQVRARLLVPPAPESPAGAPAGGTGG